ncbi:MAG: hypothetical protein K0R18_1085 [Bacillales bacterium]|jgi:hypothetical protein|nr:hypothetical protein [Bacillales bacterium]
MLKINKSSSATISNANSFSNATIKSSLSNRLNTVQSELDQATKSKLPTEAMANLSTDITKPALKLAMDNPLKYSLYLLPPFIQVKNSFVLK